MTKQEIRRELSICFLQGLRNEMAKNPELQAVCFVVKLKPEPDYSKCSNVVINFFQNQ
ncbi:hypothetical protein ACGK9U_01405 [Mariniflexile sp. HNIBRBA6329]|uniref:hypothetical protein n=1 Tax=Mariniflexile sp. HNIBRBA6329 TaxID=3373088 RepID=UPI0037477094